MSIERRRDGFTARYRGPDHRAHSKHFRSKREAELWLAVQRVAIDGGTWRDPKRSRVTVGAWSQTWIDAQGHLKVSSRTRYEALRRTHVLPRWDKVPLDRVTHSEVASWVQELTAKGLAPSTVAQAHRVLSLILGYAVKDGRLTQNVARGVPIPRRTRKPARYLTPAEVGRLAVLPRDVGQAAERHRPADR